MQSNPVGSIQPELDPDETLLWSGQPPRGIILRGIDVFLVPFSLMWGGFALFWEGAVLSSRAPLFLSLWGIPFVLVGLHLIIGRFIFDAMQRARTFYGVTNERVVIVSGLVGRTVKSLDLGTMNNVSMSSRSDRSGTIAFGPVAPFDWWGGGMWLPGGHQTSPRFERIPEVKHVYQIVRHAQRQALAERN